MAQQLIPLTNAANQTFGCTPQVDGKPLQLNFTLRYNEIAKYWVMALRDKLNNPIIDAIPLVTGNDPACNVLGQFAYLKVGSAFVLNLSGTKRVNFPDSSDLGSDFVLVWGDTPQA